MTATIVQSAIAETTSGATLTATLGSTPAQGNLLVALIGSNTTLGSPTYPWSGTPDVSNTTSRFAAVVSRVAGVAESTSVVLTQTGTRAMAMTVVEFAATPGRTWAGFDLSDIKTTLSSVTSLAGGPTGTLADPDDVVLALASVGTGTGATSSWSNSFTKINTPSTSARAFAGYLMPGATTAVSTTASWTTSGTAAVVMAAYKQTGTPGSGQNSGFFALL